MNQREKFQNDLKNIYMWAREYSYFDCLNAMLSNDESMLNEIKDCKSKMDAQITYYLNQYDQASTDEQRMAVIGSVTGDYDES